MANETTGVDAHPRLPFRPDRRPPVVGGRTRRTGEAGARPIVEEALEAEIGPRANAYRNSMMGAARRSRAACRFWPGCGPDGEAGEQGRKHRPALPSTHREEGERGDRKPQRRDDA